MTQDRLANLVGTTKSSISRWETGERDITLSALAAVAYALNCEVSDLYRDPKQPTADELLRGLDEPTRRQAIRLIEALKTGT